MVAGHRRIREYPQDLLPSQDITESTLLLPSVHLDFLDRPSKYTILEVGTSIERIPCLKAQANTQQCKFGSLLSASLQFYMMKNQYRHP